MCFSRLREVSDLNNFKINLMCNTNLIFLIDISISVIGRKKKVVNLYLKVLRVEN